MASITEISGSDFSTYCGGNYQAMRGVASSIDGRIIYVSMNGVSNYGVIKSTDNGLNWNTVYTTGGGYTSIACNSDGSIVYFASLGTGLYKSTDGGNNYTQIKGAGESLPGGSANPETNGAFPGYDFGNVYQIACDSTGTKLMMTTNAAASIYQSIDGGSTWSFIYSDPSYNTNPHSPTTIASNAAGTVLYAALNNSSLNIIVSKDLGVTWTSLNMLGVSGPFTALSTNSYGDFVFAVDSFSNLNILYPTHVDNAVLTPSGGNTYVSLASYNDGSNLIISQNNYQSITNGAVVLYSVTNKYAPGNLTCFKDDSNIL
jgi:hypothetical protein